MGIAPIVVMAVAVIGMLVGLSRQKAGVAWGKPAAICCILMALAAALWSSVSTMGGGAASEDVANREQRYREIAGEKMGAYLASSFSGSKILVLTEPQIGSAPRASADLITGLKKGIGSALTITAEVAPEIPRGGTDGMPQESAMAGAPSLEGPVLPPMRFWYNAKAFDAILSSQPGFDILVTTIGLPADAGSSTILKNAKKRPKIAILAGSIVELQGSFRQDMVVAGVAPNPKGDYENKSIPKNLDEAFGRRFVLVVADNVMQVAADSPGIFNTAGR